MNIAEGIVLGILAGFSIYDLKTKKIPVAAAIFFAIGVLAYRCLTGTGLWVLLAGMVPGEVLLLLAFLTKESIGTGDGLILCVLGLFCGLTNTLAVLGMALVLASMVAIVLLIGRRAGRKTELPFLPCLFAGYLLRFLW